MFPERLLIYHAGTPRTTFLACLKLTTLFTFAFFSLVVTPTYLASDKPVWQAAGGEFPPRAPSSSFLSSHLIHS